MPKNAPTRRRAAAVQQARARGDERRSWLSELAQRYRAEAEKRRKARKKKAKPRRVEWIVQHHQPGRAWWRERGLKNESGNKPYRNPRRVEKLARAGRLRKELR